MMSLTTPSAGYKPFRYPWAFEAWQKQQQVHWLPEEVPMGDDKRDWDFKLTPVQKNLLSQIFRFFVQGDVEVADCFVTGTEILTQRGFVDFEQLKPDDLVAQVNADTMRTTFVPPTRVVKRRHTGDIISWKNDIGTINVAVTPNHEMLYERIGTKDAGSVHKEVASSLNMTQYKLFHTAASAEGAVSELTPKERLLIAFQADGAKRLNSGGDRKPDYTMTFAFLKDRKIERMRALIKETGYPFIEDTQDSQWGVYTTFRVKYPDGQPPFDLSWVDLKDKSAAWCQEFLEEASHWDSWVKGGYVQYRSTVKASADMMTAIRTLAGYRGKTTHNTYDYQSEHWLVSWSNEYKPVRGSCLVKSTNQYDGDVHCVTVPDGNIIVRYEGATLICGNCYHQHYMNVFKPIEVKMMLSAFANMETIHIAAYSVLLETVNMPDSEFTAFMNYKSMKDKHDFMKGYSHENPYQVARTLAGFGAFTEGLQLFASFAMLMNFPRQNLMKGMGQIVTWSVRDETMHCDNIIRLYHTYREENAAEIDGEALDAEITKNCREIVDHEDAFIDEAFAMGDVPGMKAEDVKQYIRYVADWRLRQLKLPSIYHVKENPLPWLDNLLTGKEHANFFEARSTEYSKAATKGTMEEIQW